MRILVTGATGFIGKYLVKRLIADNHNIRILVRDKQKAIDCFGDSCEIFKADIVNKISLNGCCENIDVVFHLASLTGHNLPSKDAFANFRKVNVEGLKNLIDECKKNSIKKFIYVSSTAAIGLIKNSVVDETTECKPYTPYQITKREAEIAVLSEFQDSLFPSIVVRPSMIYGPGFKGDLFTLTKICKTGFFPKIGFGKNLSPALFVTDLVDGLVKTLEQGILGETYILTSECSYELQRMVRAIGKALHKKIYFVYVPQSAAIGGAVLIEKLCILLKRKPPFTGKNIESRTTNRIFDISKAKNELKFAPKIELEEGIARTIQYYVNELFV